MEGNIYTYNKLNNGDYYKQDISYSSLLKKHIKKHSNFLQPIFEAISNSLESTNGSDDCITIRLNFSKTTFQGKFDFTSIDIIDTGTGFNDESMLRFKSLYDESKGQNNLGTGRVQYLHFFHNTNIQSVFIDELGNKISRRIVLSKKFLEHKSIMWLGNRTVEDNKTPVKTVVSFYNTINEDDKNKYCELTTKELKEAILVRYLSRFCLRKGNLQTIKIEQYMNQVHDSAHDCYIKDEDIPSADYTDTISVSYHKVGTDGKTLVKTPKKENFEIKSFRLPSTIQKKNEVRLTSKDETVDVASKIDFSFIHNSPKIGTGYLLFLVSSPYLTGRDTDLRGNLLIYSRKDFLKNRNLWSNEEEIFVDDIQEKTILSITKRYEPIRNVKDKFDDDINKLAEMFSLDKRVLNNVGYKVGDTPQEILKRVYEYDAEISAKQGANIKIIIDSIDELIPGSEGFNKKLNEKIKKVTELVPQFNRTELTKYVSKRKVVLELMQKAINKKLKCQERTEKKKRINNEKFLHNILFNQHSNNPLDSNLWMINDDFIHFQGDSESELRNLKIENELFFREDLTQEEQERLTAFNRDHLGNRPDILLFPKEHKCIIIELKSIDADVSNFVSQVSKYAGLIRQFAKDKFEITMFYSYLIGESFTLSEVKTSNPYLKKAYYFDYLYAPNYPVDGGEKRRDGEMYIEVIKYSTLLERARLRNKIFTDKI